MEVQLRPGEAEVMLDVGEVRRRSPGFVCGCGFVWLGQIVRLQSRGNAHTVALEEWDPGSLSDVVPIASDSAMC